TTRPPLTTVTRTIPIIACDGATEPSHPESAIAATQRARCLLMGSALFRSGPEAGSWRSATANFRQRLRVHELQPLRGVVAMNFLHIELAHEVNRILGDDLPGHHDREAWRIRDDEVGG